MLLSPPLSSSSRTRFSRSCFGKNLRNWPIVWACKEPRLAPPARRPVMLLLVLELADLRWLSNDCSLLLRRCGVGGGRLVLVFPPPPIHLPSNSFARYGDVATVDYHMKKDWRFYSSIYAAHFSRAGSTYDLKTETEYISVE